MADSEPTAEDKRAAARLLMEDRIADIERHRKMEEDVKRKRKGGESK